MLRKIAMLVGMFLVSTGSFAQGIFFDENGKKWDKDLYVEKESSSDFIKRLGFEINDAYLYDSGLVGLVSSSGETVYKLNGSYVLGTVGYKTKDGYKVFESNLEDIDEISGAENINNEVSLGFEETGFEPFSKESPVSIEKSYSSGSLVLTEGVVGNNADFEKLHSRMVGIQSNPGAKKIISIAYDPYCDYCHEMHKIVDLVKVKNPNVNFEFIPVILNGEKGIEPGALSIATNEHVLENGVITASSRKEFNSLLEKDLAKLKLKRNTEFFDLMTKYSNYSLSRVPTVMAKSVDNKYMVIQGVLDEENLEKLINITDENTSKTLPKDKNGKVDKSDLIFMDEISVKNNPEYMEMINRFNSQ